MKLLNQLAIFNIYNEVTGLQARLTHRNNQYQLWIGSGNLWMDISSTIPDLSINRERTFTAWLEHELMVYTLPKLNSFAHRALIDNWAMESRTGQKCNAEIDGIAQLAILMLERDPIALDMARDILRE